jgi:hypothetical protein
MERPGHWHALLGTAALFLAACASQPNAEPSKDFTPVTVVTGGDNTVIYPVTGFNRGLLDDEYQCRLWAYGRSGQATRPCAGVVPSCGAPIPFSEVSVVASEVAHGPESLVTRGTYRARIEQTVEHTKRQLAVRVAREGCDLLIVDGEEWISLGRGNNFRYLQVRWGSTKAKASDQAMP